MRSAVANAGKGLGFSLVLLPCIRLLGLLARSDPHSMRCGYQQ